MEMTVGSWELAVKTRSFSLPRSSARGAFLSGINMPREARLFILSTPNIPSRSKAGLLGGAALAYSLLRDSFTALDVPGTWIFLREFTTGLR
jgi:hypothetical protein